MPVPAAYSRFARLLVLRDRLTALFAGPRRHPGARLAAEVLEDRVTPTTVSLSDPAVSGAIPGQQFTASTTVTPDTLSTTPTGTVTFYADDGGGPIPLGTAPLVPATGSDATATLVVTGFVLPASMYTYSVVYSGDGTYAANSYTSLVSGGTLTPIGGPSPAAAGPAGTTAGGLRVTDGAFGVVRTDLTGGGFGTPWGVTWTWSNGAGYSDGMAGEGATLTPLPRLVRANGTDALALVGSATDARYFDLVGGSYLSRSGDLTSFAADAPNGTFVATDPDGTVWTFYDFSGGTPAGRAGTLVSAADPAGNLTEVTAWTGAGQPAEVERTAGTGGSAVTESFVYSYLTSGVNAGRIDGVTLRRKVGAGSWATVRSVAYTYHDGTTSDGLAGDLKLAVVSDAASNPIDTSYYRYYTSGGGTGYAHGLKYDFGPAAYARLTAALGTGVSSLTDGQVDDYADEYLEYDASKRVTTRVTAGAGGAASGGLGAFTYTYTSSSFVGGTNTWRYKTVETRPDGTAATYYANAVGGVMLAAVTDGSLTWVSATRYDGVGRAVLEAAPSAVTGYSDTYPDLLNDVSGNLQYLADAAGLVTTYTFATATTATTSTAGDATGYLTSVSIQRGEGGTAVPQQARTYIETPAGTFAPAGTTVYRNDNGTGGITTTTTYTWQGSTAQPDAVTTTLPVVTTGQNGSGSATTAVTVSDTFGRPVWAKDQAGFLTYTEYDPTTGAVVKTIADVDDAQTATFSGLPTGWATPAAGGLHRTTAYEVDALGRVTKVTHPGGRVDYTVYLDAAREVRSYPAWDTTANAPTGPTTVVRENRANGYVETLTMSATPAVSSGRPTGSESVSSVLSLSRTHVNSAGQAVSADAYFDLTGLTYSTSASLGTSGTHFDRTTTAYDAGGRADRSVTPLGTITRTVYDALGRAAGIWVGTDDTPTTGDWSPANTTGTNLVLVRDDEYDGGGAGDGNLTSTTAYPGLSAAARVTETYYDWRNRPVAVKAGVEGSEGTGVNRPITYTDYDNLGRATGVRAYDGDGVTVSSSGGVPTAPSSGLLRAKSETSYDDLGRVYRTDQYLVDPATGSVGTYTLHTDTFYDARGLVLKSAAPGGRVTKTAYDGLGRAVVTYLSDGGGDSAYAHAADVAGDAVFEQTEPTYDAAGRVTRTITRQRFHDETGTGDLSALSARVYYAGSYYDLADRLIASVDIGTSPAGTYSWPSTPPTSTAAVLVSLTSYDAAGRVYETTDPLGRVTRTTYDTLGRVAKTVENYVNGTVSDGNDKTTEYTYNAAGRTSLTARLTGGGGQTTEWVYGVTTGGGSGVNSNDVVGATRWPDASTGASSSSEQETVTVNALGQTVTATDRNGSMHTLTYDVLGRVTADADTTLGTGVNGSVRRIETGYDGQGNVYLVTSYNAASGGSVLNELRRAYNGLGQLTTEWQAHSGAVNTSTSPKVEYAYGEMAGGTNQSHRLSVTYPGGQVADYQYDAVGRVIEVGVGGDDEVYEYLGAGTVVLRTRSNGTALTYVKRSGESNGDAGDKYTGLDRFGRVVDQRWLDPTTGTATDRLQYGYDRAGNRVFRDNLVNAAFGELYAYDGLDQLTSFDRGTLNGPRTGLTGAATRTQDWDYDAVGNWDGIDVDGVTESRTANRQNEYTGVGSLTTPTYDANGNMTRAESGLRYEYDAWNRLVVVVDSIGLTTLASFTYDGLGRRLTRTDWTATTDLFYSADWQVVEEQIGGDTANVYVWSPVYVDALLLRDRDTNANGVVDERLWVQQDVNWNVTALADGSGAVVERFVYDPFGSFTVYSPTYTVAGSSGYDWVYQHQGLRWDGTAELYDNRHRWYSPTLGRFISIDPMGFGAGDQNLYRYVGNGPVTALDPSGLDRLYIRGGIQIGGLYVGGEVSWGDNGPGLKMTIGGGQSQGIRVNDFKGIPVAVTGSVYFSKGLDTYVPGYGVGLGVSGNGPLFAVPGMVDQFGNPLKVGPGVYQYGDWTLLPYGPIIRRNVPPIIAGWIDNNVMSLDIPLGVLPGVGGIGVMHGDRGWGGGPSHLLGFIQMKYI